MATDYLPTTDAGFVGFAANFSTFIGADPLAYGLTQPQADRYQTLTDAFTALWTSTQRPTNNDTANIAAKNNARDELEQDTRGLVKIIQANPDTTDNQREELGITVPDTTPTAAPLPDKAGLEILENLGRSVRVRVRDTQNPDNRGKPDRVAAAATLYYFGETPPNDMGDWTFSRLLTRTIGEINFPPTAADGSKVWITAYWLNTRGQSGLAAPPQSTYIGGGVSEAA